MCGRVTLLSGQEIEEVLSCMNQQLELLPFEDLPAMQPEANQWQMRKDAFPGMRLQAIVENESCDSFQLRELGWGYPVEWQKAPVFNTRIESALDGRTMWADSFQNRRCVLPVAAFYEPHATQTVASQRTGKQVKRPYLFADPTGLPVFLAGVFEAGYVSILTTQPNDVMAPIHKRMPLVLRYGELGEWYEKGSAKFADRSLIPLMAVAEDGFSGYASPNQEQISLF